MAVLILLIGAGFIWTGLRITGAVLTGIIEASKKNDK